MNQRPTLSPTARSMMARLDRLPLALRDGRVTHCAISRDRGRIRFRETEVQLAQRRLKGLRQRALYAATSGVGLVITAVSRGPLQAVAGLVTSLSAIAVLDGLRRDLRGGIRPRDLAILDLMRGEVDLRTPDGWAFRAHLNDVHMFLLVAEPDGRYHLGVVLYRYGFMPWLSTTAAMPAASLTWLFGHLSGRPAMHLAAELPIDDSHLAAAEPLAAPGVD